MHHPFYVITPIFNPYRFKSRVRLYEQFKKHMAECGAILLTVEVAFGNHHFEVTSPDNPWDIQLRSDQIIWHKERMINIGIHHLRRMKPDAKYIGWFDADISFSDPDWVAKTVHKLMIHPIVQPFSQTIFLNYYEEYMWNVSSAACHFVQERGYHQEPPIPLNYIAKGHPGLAWAATVEALDWIGGLYDVCACGSADTVMINCIRGDHSTFLPAGLSEGLVRSMKKWEDRCSKYIQSKIGYVRGTVLHHWHGKSENRGYEKRWSILVFHKFDPYEDLVLDTQGLWKWAGNKPKLQDDILFSLASRNEDEI